MHRGMVLYTGVTWSCGSALFIHLSVRNKQTNFLVLLTLCIIPTLLTLFQPIRLVYVITLYKHNTEDKSLWTFSGLTN